MNLTETAPQVQSSEILEDHPKPVNIDAAAAKRFANRFILENLPDRFCAGTPRFLQFPLKTFWTVPVVLSYPRIGPVGETGVVAIDIETGSAVGWTPFDEMKRTAGVIYEKKKREIEAAIL